MKNLIYFISAGLFIVQLGCDNPSANKETTTAKEEHHHHDAGEALSLNNGQKWKSDDATRANVGELKGLVAAFENQENKTLPDYLSLGNKLSDAFTKLLSECRMSGPDHDALHKWLMPIESSIKELKNSKTETDAGTASAKISEQLALFDTYFE